MTSQTKGGTMSIEDEEKSARAAKVVRNYMFGSAAAGILPIPPLLDAGLLWGVQLRMLHQLAKIYEVEFSQQRALAILGALSGLGLTVSVGTLLWMLVPVPGKILFNLAGLTLPPASTYALGQVFIQHFESGGTFLTFDEKRAKKVYEENLARGQQEAIQSYAGIKPEREHSQGRWTAMECRDSA